MGTVARERKRERVWMCDCLGGTLKGELAVSGWKDLRG